MSEDQHDLSNMFSDLDRDLLRQDPMPQEEIPGMQAITDQVVDIIRGETGRFQRFDIGKGKGNLSTSYDSACVLVPTQDAEDRSKGDISTAYLTIGLPYRQDEIPASEMKKKILTQKRISAKDMKKRWPKAKFDKDQGTPTAFMKKNLGKPIAVIAYTKQGDILTVYCPDGKSPDWAIGRFKDVLPKASK